MDYHSFGSLRFFLLALGLYVVTFYLRFWLPFESGLEEEMKDFGYSMERLESFDEEKHEELKNYVILVTSRQTNMFNQMNRDALLDERMRELCPALPLLEVDFHDFPMIMKIRALPSVLRYTENGGFAEYLGKMEDVWENFILKEYSPEVCFDVSVEQSQESIEQSQESIEESQEHVD